jgi:endo-1,4-beta-xylanase
MGARIGVAWRVTSSPSDQVIQREFNQVIGGCSRWRDFEPARGRYNLSQLERSLALAERNGMSVLGLHLLWDSTFTHPEWLVADNFTEDELTQVRNDHVARIAEYCRGRVRVWSAVNEPVFQDWQYRTTGQFGSFWHARYGGLDYMDEIFSIAHTADPEAILVWNEYNNHELHEVSNIQYEHVQRMLDRGVPIHGIGIQAHTDARFPPNPDLIRENMERFAALGVSLHITEMDVKIEGLTGSTDEILALQATIYRQIVGAALDAGCRDINIFGLLDGDYIYEGAGNSPYLLIPIENPSRPTSLSWKNSSGLPSSVHRYRSCRLRHSSRNTTLHGVASVGSGADQSSGPVPVSFPSASISVKYQASASATAAPEVEATSGTLPIRPSSRPVATPRT